MKTRIAAPGTALLICMAGPAAAQWSSDPAANLLIADGASEQTQAKLAATSDGGAYVSWYDNSAGGYDVRLQRLDALGNELWPHNGVLLADTGFGSTQDYDLAVGPGDEAYLTFRDDRPGGIQITATRVSAAGVQVWGAAGVQLTSTAEFVAAPKIALTTDGDAVVAWRQGNDTILQKLDPSGIPQWGAGLTISDPGGSSFSASDLNASDGGSVIIALVKGFMAATLHAQKISSSGAPRWNGGSPVAVFDGSTLQVANFPTFVNDGAGGAVFGWYGNSPLQCYVQHLLADGSEEFPHDGVVASTDLTRRRVSPAVSYRAATDEIFLFWNELNSLQSQWGVYGQKFDGAGARQWGDDGRVLVPLDGLERTQVRAIQFEDGALVFWVEAQSFGNQRVFASRVDGGGQFVWDDATPTVSSLLSGKSRLVAERSSDGVALLGWIDSRSDAGDVYGQSLHGDGTLGNGNVPGDVDGDGDVDIGDLLALLAAWGPCPGGCPPSCPADFDGDCAAGITDLLALLATWG